MVYFVGRGNGKSIESFKQFCERAAELELQIEFAKKFGLPCDNQLTERNKIYELLDRGRDETSSKKYKNKKR